MLFAAALLLIAAGCSKQPLETPEAETAPSFVGSQQCASCHQDEYELWQGSHHESAMQVANDTTVLGDFSEVEFEYFKTRTSLFRKDGAFMVRTENAVGEQQEFEITHTFGAEPLQQYLVGFPDGRKTVPAFYVGHAANRGRRSTLVSPVRRRIRWAG